MREEVAPSHRRLSQSKDSLACAEPEFTPAPPPFTLATAEECRSSGEIRHRRPASLVLRVSEGHRERGLERGAWQLAAFSKGAQAEAWHSPNDRGLIRRGVGALEQTGLLCAQLGWGLHCSAHHLLPPSSAPWFTAAPRPLCPALSSSTLCPVSVLQSPRGGYSHPRSLAPSFAPIFLQGLSLRTPFLTAGLLWER